MAEIRRMAHRTLPEHYGGRQRSQADAGPGEPGNDDDQATRITARGNEAIAFVRGYFQQGPNMNTPRTSNRNRGQEMR